jgi:hypothetical protein
MKFAVLFAIGFIAIAAPASIPTGQQFDAWHVSSITSLSGTEGNDASASISQQKNCDSDGNGCDELDVHWIQGGNVVISANFQDCYREDEDFEPAYSVSVDRWLHLGKGIEGRIEADFRAWTEQAHLSCANPARIDAFKLTHVRQAVRNFTQRLAYLSQ